MFCQWSRSASKSHLSAISGLVFHHAVVFLLLTLYCGGQSAMVGPSKPIVGMLGDDIMLPCHLEPPTDVVSETLEWSRTDLDPRFVHVRRDGVELLLNQNPSYIGRTSLSTNKLKHGDMSMTLSKVRLTDEGTYRCHIPQHGTSRVQLVVGVLSVPVVIIAEIDKTISRAVLQCESKGWYPEPEVFWLDSEGHVLSAGPTETVRGPDGLFTVSSRVTVEKRHSNNFTCRVQQRDINQTRETEIRILEDVFTAHDRGSVVRITVVLTAVWLLIFPGGFFVLWKQNRNCDRMHSDNRSKAGKGERQQFIKGSAEMKDLYHKKLEEKKVEKKDMIHVISVLMKQKEELESSRDKLMSQVDKDHRKNDKKSEKRHKGFHRDREDKKSESIAKLDDKKTKYESLQSTIESLQETENMITRIKDKINKIENKIKQINEQLEETKRQNNVIELKSEREKTNKNPDSTSLTEINVQSNES